MPTNKGIIYILGNPFYYDKKTEAPIYKIGSTKDLIGRISQLNSKTAVPHAFTCVFAFELDNYVKVEKDIQKAFDIYRVNDNREFYKFNPDDITPLFKHFFGFKEVSLPEKDLIKTDNTIEEIKEIPKNYFTYAELKKYLNVPAGFNHWLFGFRVSCLHTRKEVKTYKTKDKQYYNKDVFKEAAKKEGILK